MGRLADKVAIVTGAASAKGFGFATARLFAREGAKVVLTDIVADAVQTRAAELSKEGLAAVGLAHDVTSESSWQQVFARTLREFGKLDVLVNNAGIATLGNIDSTTLQAWDRMIAINLTGVFLGCQGAVRQFRAQKSKGSIINIASSAALNAHPDNTAYCSSKGGVMLLTKTVALDVAAEGIRVNSVHPGMMNTDMTATALKADPSLVQAIINNVPMRQLGAPEDIATMNLFLASDEAKYITGTRFSVDGGLTAK
jgi:NAD(P)-dependent dehydrogenase (short-subunit alcohol dehydrogenase family)